MSLRRPRCFHAALTAGLCLALIACPETPASDTADPGAPPAAPTAESAERQAPSFDYPGGWLDDDACVDICGASPGSPVERPPAVVCFDKADADCASKTGVDDYDYLMLSQHWLPSMCLGLEAGYDSTVTHQAGARCTSETSSVLAIHGLWPNYQAGFPQCCGSALPLDPQAVRAWPEDLRARLQAQQPDPTTSDFDAAICEIYNHEWQKHGTCFVDTVDTDADARSYFEVGIELADRLARPTVQLNAWAGSTRRRAEIEALYPKAVQVLCDSRQEDRLLEIHTCWSRELEMVDCAPTAGFGALKACGEEVTLPVWAP